MLSETLVNGLGQYRIGAKVRALRQKKQLGLAQLGAHTGLSPGMLSKIERGQLVPTLPTLLRIALVFGVGLDHFFTERDAHPDVAVVRKGDRVRLPHPSKGAPFYVFESLDYPLADRPMEAYYAEFPAEATPSQPHRHAGTEFVFVVKGRLAVTIDDHETLLDEGDAITFNSDVPHSYRRDGRSACAAIVAVASRAERIVPAAQPPV